MKKVKRMMLLAVLPLLATTAKAQDKDFCATISADVVNQYIWRGLDVGNASIQPSLGLGWKGLSLTAWGSVGITEASDTKELDLTLSYATGGFNIGITDYWFNTGQDPRNRYFKYDSHGTNHVFEVNVGYDFGVASLQWYTNFAGNDGVNKDGKRAYSSYVEAAVPFSLAGADWSAVVGAVPYATTSYSTTGFAVTNVSLKATKNIRVTDTFSVPIFGQVVANPCSQKAYLVLGFMLQP